MTWCVRSVTLYLWRFQWFRLVVVQWIAAGWPGSTVLAVHTPFLFSLKQLWLQRGDLAQAAHVAALMRQTDPL